MGCCFDFNFAMKFPSSLLQFASQNSNVSWSVECQSDSIARNPADF